MQVLVRCPLHCNCNELSGLDSPVELPTKWCWNRHQTFTYAKKSQCHLRGRISKVGSFIFYFTITLIAKRCLQTCLLEAGYQKLVLLYSTSLLRWLRNDACKLASWRQDIKSWFFYILLHYYADCETMLANLPLVTYRHFIYRCWRSTNS